MDPRIENSGRIHTAHTVNRVALCASLLLALGSALAAQVRMADGKYWSARNLNLAAADSYCYADGEWRRLALLTSGSSGFNALLGGGRSVEGQYGRLAAHGFYWTASETDSLSAVVYNFAQGSLSLNRQAGGEKLRAFSVRCVGP